MKNTAPLLALAVSITLAGMARAQVAGPSSSQTSYLLPSGPSAGNITATSLLTVGDIIGGYKMVGIPDGLGAIDNNPGTPGVGTFTVFMNHELGSTLGAVRAHGSVGSFVSKWTIDKSTLQVLAGTDLIQQVATWNTGTDTFNAAATGIAIGRLCSGDLAQVSAYSFGGVGTTERIFLSGEETGAEGRLFAHVATGTDAGKSYELADHGKYSWENAVANWGSGATTAVLGTDDSTPGQVYLYLGTKQATGNTVERSGLVGGNLYGIRVPSVALELRTNGVNGTPGGFDSVAFSLASLGDVSSKTGATLQSESVTAGVTEFLRPEDIVWDLNDASIAYFVTTDRFSQVEAGTGAQEGKSRLWKLDFTSEGDFTLGGQLTMLLNGDDAGQMFDNMTVTLDGTIVLQEDPGGGATPGNYLAKVWEYDIATGTLKEILQHDGSRFASNNATFNNTNDEESSGVIDVTSFFTSTPLPGEHYYLMDVQAHHNAGYQIDATTVEGGQLNLVHVVPEPSTAVALLGGVGMLLGLRRRRSA